MFKRIALAVSLIASPTVLCAEPPIKLEPLEETRGATIGYATVGEALSTLRLDKAAKFSERNGWTIVQVGESGQSDFALWSFTPPGHPAYPAAVKRTVYEQNGQIMIGMQVQCEAAKEPCDQLVRDFLALNERMKAALGTQHEP